MNKLPLAEVALLTAFLVMMALAVGLTIYAAKLESAPQKEQLCPYLISQSQIRAICLQDLECWSRAEYLSKGDAK